MTEIRSISKTQCSGCQKYFVGVSAFDAHRTGSYGEAIYDKKDTVIGHTPHSRHCLSTEEMQAAGFDSETRMVRFRIENKKVEEEHQVWFQIAKRESIRKAFARSADEEDEDEEVDDE